MKRTIKHFAPIVWEYRSQMKGKCNTKWANEIARNIVNYCEYLENVLATFKRVTVTVETHPGTRYISEGHCLKVKYSNGESSIYLDVIFWGVLLPEVEAILKAHRKKLIYNTIAKAA